MNFTSRLGEGATFWFEIPVQLEENPHKDKVEAPMSRVSGKSILIVDDEPDILNLLSKIIQTEGSEPDCAQSLKEALAKIALRSYDLIVADVRLGEGTGIELYENWNKWSSGQRPVFVFMSGDILESDHEKLLQAKGLILLKKPVNLETFQNFLRQLLSP